MGNRRRRDKAHDIGDSMPGTEGHSEGTFHDRYDTQTFDPSEDDVMSEAEVEAYLGQSSKKEKQRSKNTKRQRE